MSQTTTRTSSKPIQFFQFFAVAELLAPIYDTDREKTTCQPARGLAASACAMSRPPSNNSPLNTTSQSSNTTNAAS